LTLDRTSGPLNQRELGLTDTAKPPELRDPLPLWGWLKVFLVLYALGVFATGIFNAAFLLVSGGDPNYYPAASDLPGLALTFGLLATSFPTVGIFLVCMFLVARVTYRMMRNLHQLGSGHVTIGPFWSVGWYFIPFANLVMPVRAMGEIWRGTFAEAEGEPPREPDGAIGWWWACWLLGNVAEGIASRTLGAGFGQTPITPTTEALYFAIGLYSVSALFGSLASIFLMLLLSKVVRAQSQMVKLVALS
jgi:hypothetical protein